MELKKITVKNFKKVSDVELDLANLNILVGANASGKSSILQAIHLASCLLRQAKERLRSKPTVISVNELDYLPTNDYKKLGNSNDLGNQEDSPFSEIKFQIWDNNLNKEFLVNAEIRSARNAAGISVKGNLPQDVGGLFRGVGNFFSAYIPGISGMPNEEQKQSKRVVLKACSFGDANFYLRNALLLLDNSEVRKIETWLGQLIAPIGIDVKHDNERDLNISTIVKIGVKDIPLELLGMGYLQLIQIFCYLLLFSPKVLLIDEPDIHLHPNVQEKLPKLLSIVAVEQEVKIILSTHSPFIVRGAPLNTNVFWMDNGSIQGSNRETVELALGWGAFGKKIIIFSEDAKPDLLKKIIAQWPDVEKLVAVHPGNGHSNLLKPEHAEELKSTLGDSFKIVIHRDRDSMTDDEVDMLKQGYSEVGVNLWITDESDIEAYFCEPSFLAELLGISSTKAHGELTPIIDRLNKKDNEQFLKHRKAHNNEIYASTGGSPESDKVWQSLQDRTLKVAGGKTVFKELKNGSKNNAFSENTIITHQLNGKIALSLKVLLESLL